jgi:CAAX protease family protein
MNQTPWPPTTPLERAPSPPAPTVPGVTLWLILRTLVLAEAAGIGLALATRFAVPEPVIARVVAFYAGLYGVLLWRCNRIAGGWGRVREAFGLRIKWEDLPLGFAFAIGGILLEVVAVSPFLHDSRFRGSNTGLLVRFEHDLPSYAVVAALAVVVAPVCEELFFRGLVLRGLTARYGTTGALLTTTAAFALVHIQPFAGTHNVMVLVAVSSVGLVLGMAALRYRRLGPGVVSHGLINLLAVVLIFSR